MYQALNSSFHLDADKCYGGIARLATAIKDVRNKDENVILLNAGDIFQGTVWYSEFKWRPMAKFTNILNITAAVGVPHSVMYFGIHMQSS